MMRWALEQAIGHQRHAGFDGHHRGPLLEFLQAAVGASRPFGINQKTLTAFQGFCGLFEAGDGGVSIEPVHGNESGEMKGLANNRIFEKRALQQDGDTAGMAPTTAGASAELV